MDVQKYQNINDPKGKFKLNPIWSTFPPFVQRLFFEKQMIGYFLVCMCEREIHDKPVKIEGQRERMNKTPDAFPSTAGKSCSQAIGTSDPSFHHSSIANIQSAQQHITSTCSRQKEQPWVNFTHRIEDVYCTNLQRLQGWRRNLATPTISFFAQEPQKTA